jgi:hypothetical protein
MWYTLFAVWGPDPAYKMPEENSEKGESCNNYVSEFHCFDMCCIVLYLFLSIFCYIVTFGQVILYKNMKIIFKIVSLYIDLSNWFLRTCFNIIFLLKTIKLLIAIQFVHEVMYFMGAVKKSTVSLWDEERHEN